jgi:hypothetical protein
MKRSALLLAFAMALVLAVATAASATWQAGSAANSKGRAAATTMPQGATPTASANGTDVTVSWSPVTTPADATGYTVNRYDATTHAVQTVEADCAGVAATNTCVEHAVPPGDWQYTVKPKLHAWTGAESEKSDPVTVP